MRIGIFGGAFDPPHAAHASLAEAARRQLKLDRILWVPTFAPPHKEGPAASFADRAAMARALVGDDPGSEVSAIEASLPQPSYTLHTLRALKALHGAEHSWHLILGADNGAGFLGWHQPKAVLAEAALVIYPREGFPAGLSPAGAVMLDFPVMKDQSTDYRDALASAPRREEALEALPASVAVYIREHGLYRGPDPKPSWLSLSLLALLCLGFAAKGWAQSAPVDSVSAVFRADSTKAEAVRSLEAGAARASQDSTNVERNDSLLVKQRRRGPYIGLSAGVSFADNSSKKLFSDYMASTVSPADSSRIVQAQDPVEIIIPVGLVIGFPVFTYLDVWLRTEHFWSRVNGLTQRNNESPREFWYVAQGHLAGVGARYLVPVSLLSVNGQPGLYAAYTHFWNFGPTGMYAPTGGVRAKTDPAGAGYEVQLGYQQDYDKRFTVTYGLSFSRLSFASNSSWKAIIPTAPDVPAQWTLQALRFAAQAVYQFGK